MGATTENARSPLHLYFDLGMNNSLGLEDRSDLLGNCSINRSERHDWAIPFRDLCTMRNIFNQFYSAHATSEESVVVPFSSSQH